MNRVGFGLGPIIAGTIALGLASGCSGDDDGGGGSGVGCNSAAQAVCNKLNSCFPALVQIIYGDVATCVTRGELGCNADVSAAGSNTTNANLGSCAAAYSDASCESLINAAPDACIVPGERGDGEACAASAQCQSTHCNTGTSNCGTCAPLSAAGGPCDTGDDCENGLVCASSVCAVPVAAGGACTESAQCSGFLICKGGTCATPGAAGQPCTPSASDCDFTQALYCDPASSTCKLIQFAGPGESCGLVDNTLVACSGGGDCSGSPTGTCTAPAADGASCSPAETGPNCVPPAECVNGSCQLPNPEACG